MEALPPGDEPNDDVGVDVDYGLIRSLRRAREDHGNSPHIDPKDSIVGQTEFEHDDVENIGDVEEPPMPRACDLDYPEGCDPEREVENDRLHLWDDADNDGPVTLAFVASEDYIEDVRNYR